MVWDSAVRGNFFYKQVIQLSLNLKKTNKKHFNYFEHVLSQQIAILNFRQVRNARSSWGLDGVTSNLIWVKGSRVGIRKISSAINDHYREWGYKWGQ